MAHDLRSLVTRLNDTTRQSLEGAAGLCLSRTHYEVEVEHWLLKLLDQRDTEFGLALGHYQLDAGRMARDLESRLESLKSGNEKTPALSPLVVLLMTEAWLGASLGGDTKIRTGHLLLALLTDSELRRNVSEMTKELDKVDIRDLPQRLAILRSRSVESAGIVSDSSVPPAIPRQDAFSFVSYDRADQEFVFWLASELRKQNVEVWLDQWAINSGDDWDEAIDSAIDRCGHFIVVLTPRSAKSKEVQGEIRAALNRSKRIIPVLRETCNVPRRLLTIQHLDFTGPDQRHQTVVLQLARLLSARGDAGPARSMSEDDEAG